MSACALLHFAALLVGSSTVYYRHRRHHLSYCCSRCDDDDYCCCRCCCFCCCCLFFHCEYSKLFKIFSLWRFTFGQAHAHKLPATGKPPYILVIKITHHPSDILGIWSCSSHSHTIQHLTMLLCVIICACMCVNRKSDIYLFIWGVLCARLSLGHNRLSNTY